LELTCNKELDKENTDSLAVDRFGPLQNDNNIKHIKETRVPKKYIEKHLAGTSSLAAVGLRRIPEVLSVS